MNIFSLIIKTSPLELERNHKKSNIIVAEIGSKMHNSHENHQDISDNFTYRPNPFLAKSFLICKKERSGEVTPVGDYTVLDRSEDTHLSERKVMNLVMRMNGEKNLVPLGGQTRSRMLFHVKPKSAGEMRTEIIFYTQSCQGVSKENAILTMEGLDE